jgi:hypothetical protein
VNTPDQKVSLTEIADLLAWARRLTQARPATTLPAELAAYQACKADLLERITDQTRTQTDAQTNPETTHTGTDMEQR